MKSIANFDYKKEVIFIKKNIIVTNQSKTDVEQKEQVTAKSLCYGICRFFSGYIRVKSLIYHDHCRKKSLLFGDFIVDLFFSGTFNMKLF